MSAPITPEALDAIAHWASSSDPVAFRHLRVKHRDFNHPRVCQAIWKSVTKHHDRINFVGSEMENDVAQESARDWNWEGPTLETYVEFVDSLEKDRAQNGKGPEVWKEELQPGDTIQNRISPSRVLIIMSVEPQMPSDCALALIATVHWAADISKRKDACVRVITVSPEEEAPALRSLLELYSVPRATQVDMSGTLPTGFQIVCADPSEVATQVLYNLTPDPAGKDIVVCFPPFKRTFELGDCFQQLNDYGVLEKAWIDTDSSHWFRNGSIVTNLQLEEDTLGQLVYTSNGFRAPCGITGFDRVHIVLGSTDITPIFDAVDSQITLTELALSRDERMEQVSWIGRADCLPENIFVYLDTQHRTVEEFVEAGHGRRRLKVSGRQLGGFLSALAGMSHWGFDVYQVAEQFVHEDFALREMITRMSRQEILAPPSVSLHNSITLGMHDDERIIFKTVLPLLDYDHRLAYFLARRSSSPLLRQVKVHVVALMCVGSHDVVKFRKEVERTPTEAVADLVNACWGCTRRMATTGAIWLMLGLWSQGAKQHHSFRRISRACHHVDLPIPGTSASVNMRSAAKVADIIVALQFALSEKGVPLRQRDISQESEDLYLTKSQELELQRDLVRAYLFQFLGSSKQRVAGEEVVLTCDTLTRKAFGSMAEGSRLMIDAALQTEEHPGTVYGIYHFLKREGDNVMFQDWTWIPTQLVFE